MSKTSPGGSQGAAGSDLLRLGAIVVGVVLLAITAWLVLAPAKEYRELGPRGRRASCGSVISPLEPYASHDEVCFDALYARREVANLSGGAGLFLVVVPTLGRRLVRVLARRAGPRPPSSEEPDRMDALQARSFRSLRQRLAGRQG